MTASRRLPIGSEEQALVRRGALGDGTALDMLYSHYADGVHRLAFRICGDSDAAADTTQETFIRAFRELHDFRGESSLATWLHSIAVSVALSARRKTERRAKYHVTMEYAENTGRSDQHGDAFLRERLHAAIDELPPSFNAVFVMFAIEGYTHDDIARALGISVGTSQGYLFRARERLRSSLADLAGGI